MAINAPNFTPNSATGKWELMLLKRRFARRHQIPYVIIFGQKTSVKNEEFEIIDKLSADYDVKLICSLMSVSRSGYYDWKQRDPSTRDIRRKEIVELVKEVHEQHRTHGYRWTAAFKGNEYNPLYVQGWKANGQSSE